MRTSKIPNFLALTTVLFAGLALRPAAQAQTIKKPNILVIWGDDIGTENISYYNRGMMGYQTPNIDRVYILGPMQRVAGNFLMTMKEYPPSQSPGSFNLEGIQKKIEASMGGR